MEKTEKRSGESKNLGRAKICSMFYTPFTRTPVSNTHTPQYCLTKQINCTTTGSVTTRPVIILSGRHSLLILHIFAYIFHVCHWLQRTLVTRVVWSITEVDHRASGGRCFVRPTAELQTIGLDSLCRVNKIPEHVYRSQLETIEDTKCLQSMVNTPKIVYSSPRDCIMIEEGHHVVLQNNARWFQTSVQSIMDKVKLFIVTHIPYGWMHYVVLRKTHCIGQRTSPNNTKDTWTHAKQCKPLVTYSWIIQISSWTVSKSMLGTTIDGVNQLKILNEQMFEHTV